MHISLLTVVAPLLFDASLAQHQPTIREQIRVVAGQSSPSNYGQELNVKYRGPQLVPELLRVLNEDPLFAIGTPARERLVGVLASTKTNDSSSPILENAQQVQTLIGEYGRYYECTQSQILRGLGSTIPELRAPVKQFVCDLLSIDREVARPDEVLVTALSIGGLDAGSVPMLRRLALDPGTFRPIMMSYAQNPRRPMPAEFADTDLHLIKVGDQAVRHFAIRCLIVSTANLQAELAWIEAQPDTTAEEGYQALCEFTQSTYEHSIDARAPLFVRTLDEQRAWLSCIDRLAARYGMPNPNQPIENFASSWLLYAVQHPTLKRECAQLALRFARLDGTAPVKASARIKFAEWGYADLAQALDAP